MASSNSVPSHHRALQLETLETGLELKTIPAPQAVLGTAIVKVEYAAVLSYQREVYNGQRHYAYPKPFVGGYSCIGRVAAVGADATALQPGQLVYVDCVMHSRDNPDDTFLTALHEGDRDGTKKLCRDVWRDGAFAEYMAAPLENCIRLDEHRLCHELGYTAEQLVYLSYLLVPYGGLRDIGLEAGETIVICPATGGFGAAGVLVAIAMGARVIAMGRNETELARIKDHVLKHLPSARLETVKISGDQEADTGAVKAFGTIDAVLDMSPPSAKDATYLRSAISSLRRNGRVSLMGIIGSVFPANPWQFVGSNLMLKGKLMYEREDMVQFVKMLEAGLFAHGEALVDVKTFAMEDWKTALDVAAAHTGMGKMVSIAPRVK